MPTNAALTLLAAGLAHPQKPALLTDAGSLSYAELERKARAFAALLDGRGVRPGDAVAIRLPDSPAFFAALLGAMRLGAVPVPVGQATPEADRAHILADCEARLIIADAPDPALPTVVCGLAGPLDPAPAEAAPEPYAPDADDLAYLLYSSGSTGRPKGVPHRHADLAVPAATLAKVLSPRPGDEIILCTSKLSFSYGLMAQLAIGIGSGATVAVHSGPPAPEAVAARIRSAGPTMLFAVPTVFDSLLRLGQDGLAGSSLTRCVASGEAMPPTLFAAWRRRTGIPVVELFGATETLTSFMATDPEQDEPGTLGAPVPGFEIRLADENGREAADGRPGRLLVRGPGIADRYLRTGPILKDGWLDSGDVCVREAGRIRHLGRADDLFRTAGQWVSPGAVENRLLEHPAVAECAVVPCAVRGQQYPCAFVVATPAGFPGQGELIRFAKAGLPRHLCPIKVVAVDALPRTPTGKIQRHKLAAQPQQKTDKE